MVHNHTTDVTKSNRFIFSLVLDGLIFFAEFFGGLWTISPGYIALNAHVVLKDQSLSHRRSSWISSNKS